MKLLPCLLAALSFCLLGCDNHESEEKKLQQEVIKIHDEVMPQGGLVMNNKMKLDTLVGNLDSLKKLNASLDTVAEKQIMQNLLHELTSADDAMSEWMNKFNLDYTGKDHEAIMNYLEEEKQKIEKIKKQFSDVLNKSDFYLSSYRK
jgi:hypothetical protein